MTRSEVVQILINNFDQLVIEYDQHPPFTAYQRDCHVATMRLRRKAATAVEAVRDPEFIRSLYDTLKAWRIGQQGSKLAPFDDFADAIALRESEIRELEGVQLSEPSLDIDAVGDKLWLLIDSLNIVLNKAKIVAGTKALHHILPELVVPIDRTYTGIFFGWYPPEFQHGRRVLRTAFRCFAEVAAAVHPARLVQADDVRGWRTSTTKLIDNALVAWCLRVEAAVKLGQTAKSCV